MNFDIDFWLDTFIQKCEAAFADRLALIGLQGSYQRGEASAQSDIDLVVILDRLNTDDLAAYRRIIATMPEAEKACGFCCGKRELLHWPRFDLFQLVHDTKVLYGSFTGLTPVLRRQDVQDAIHIGASNLYHEACHSYLYHDDPAKMLPDLYKGTFFILQAVYFYKSQIYVSTKQDLLPRLSGNDAEILTLCMQRDTLSNLHNAALNDAYQKLINWCSELLTFA